MHPPQLSDANCPFLFTTRCSRTCNVLHERCVPADEGGMTHIIVSGMLPLRAVCCLFCCADEGGMTPIIVSGMLPPRAVCCLFCCADEGGMTPIIVSGMLPPRAVCCLFCCADEGGMTPIIVSEWWHRFVLLSTPCLGRPCNVHVHAESSSATCSSRCFNVPLPLAFQCAGGLRGAQTDGRGSRSRGLAGGGRRE